MANLNKVHDIDAFYDADAAVDAELMLGIGSIGSMAEIAKTRESFQERESASRHMAGLAVQEVIGSDSEFYDFEPVVTAAETLAKPNVVAQQIAVDENRDHTHAA